MQGAWNTKCGVRSPFCRGEFFGGYRDFTPTASEVFGVAGGDEFEWVVAEEQGKKTEARQALAEIYGWFTEGFDTAD